MLLLVSTNEDFCNTPRELGHPDASMKHMSATMQGSCTHLRVQVIVNEELAMARLVKESLQASDRPGVK